MSELQLEHMMDEAQRIRMEDSGIAGVQDENDDSLEGGSQVTIKKIVTAEIVAKNLGLDQKN